jgi:hypothetical protein
LTRKLMRPHYQQAQVEHFLFYMVRNENKAHSF